MQRKAFPIIAAALLAATVLSLPARAQKTYGPGPRVVALQIRVEDRETTQVRFVPLGERIPIAPGQKLRISLVGTDRNDQNAGKPGDIGVQARFFEASNRGAIALGNSGGNWVIVEGLKTSGGTAEIRYEVQGKYDMKPAWNTGRIPFELVRQASNDNQPAGLQARVEDMESGRVELYDVSERMPLVPGRQYRISLVEAYPGGNGSSQRPVDARFDFVSGRGQIERTGPNWVVVRADDRNDRNDRNNGDNRYDRGNHYGRDRVELAFDPEGSRYSSGRITFELAGNVGSTGPLPYPGNRGNDSARMRRAEDLTALLYRAVLQENASDGSGFRSDVDQIYRRGFTGLREVARDLAREANQHGVFDHRRSSEVVGDLYRTLLGRSQSNQQLWDQDAGFRENVNTMGRRDGLEVVIDAIVGSEEFQRNQRIDSSGLMREARY